MNGISVGFYKAAGPSFCAEVGPLRYRGFCIALFNLEITLGQLFVACICKGTSGLAGNAAFRIPFATQFAFHAIILIGLPFLPESPGWLCRKDRVDDAAKALARLLGPKVPKGEIDAQIAIMQYTLRKESELHRAGEARFIDLLKQPDLRRTIIGASMFIAIQIVGVPFVIGYSTFFFSQVGIKNAVGISCGIIAISIAANFTTWFLMDSVSRRPLIVWGSLALGLMLFIIGIMGSLTPTFATNAVIVVFMCIWAFVYPLTFGVGAWIIGGEISSPKLRAKAQSNAVAVACGQLFQFGVTLAMPYMLNKSAGNLGAKIGYVWGSTCTFGVHCGVLLSSGDASSNIRGAQ